MTNPFIPPVSRIPVRTPGIVRKGTRAIVIGRMAGLLLSCTIAAGVPAATGSAPGRATGIGAPAVVAVDCVSPPSSMVAWWRAESNVDDSAGIKHGSLAGGAGFGAGRVGQALALDGAGAYASVPGSSAWAFGIGDFTVEFWLNRTTDDDRRPIINNRTNPGSESMWAIEIYNLANRVEFHSGQTILLTATNLLQSATWNHVALTRSGTTLSFHVNGVPSGSAINANDFSAVNDLQIGRDLLPVNIGDLGGKTFQGALDEISIYNRGLSSTEIAAIHQAGAGGKCALGSAPDPFNFVPQTGVSLNTLATSNTITITGIAGTGPIGIVGGTYSIDGGAWTAASGMLSNGSRVALQQTSSGLYGITTTATLTVGGVSGDFNVTTVLGNPPSGCSVSQSPDTLIKPVIPGTSVTLAAACTGGNAVTSCAWSGGIASTLCQVTVSAPSSPGVYSVIASNPGGAAPAVETTVQVTNQFDVDGNGSVDALTDGLLLMRYMFGLRGEALTAGVIGTGAMRTAAEIESYLQAVMPK